MTGPTHRTICMFSNLYPPVYSGSSTQCSQLSRELVNIGHEVVVITAQADRQTTPYEKIEGVHVYRIPAYRLPKMPISLNFPWLNSTLVPGNAQRVQEILERHQPEVLHLHNHMFDLAFSAVRAARQFNKPLVTTIHTVIRHPNRFYNWVLTPVDRWFLNYLVIRKSDLILCPDATIDGYVSEAFGSVNKVLLPYGITKMSKPSKEKMEAIRKKFELDHSLVILSLGHLHEIRNRKELIEIMPSLLTRFPDLKLLIVGDIGTNSAESLARRLGVQGSVIFTGPVPHSDVPAYLGVADLEAHWFQENNPQNKTLGIAALEAMGAGKVVVGTADEDVYGKGVLNNGYNVILVSLANKDNITTLVSDLLEDKERRNTIGRRARETINAHFSWDSVCKQTVEAYESVIEKKLRGNL
jgi:glycosyltransferase involved in cell wall biosynthesis